MEHSDAVAALNIAKTELTAAKRAFKKAEIALAAYRGKGTMGFPLQPYIQGNMGFPLQPYIHRLANAAQVEYDSAKLAYETATYNLQIAKKAYYDRICPAVDAGIKIAEEDEVMDFIRSWLAKQQAPLKGVHYLIGLAWRAYREGKR